MNYLGGDCKGIPVGAGFLGDYRAEWICVIADFELQKNEVKRLKRLSCAQNRTQRVGVQCPALIEREPLAGPARLAAAGRTGFVGLRQRPILDGRGAGAPPLNQLCLKICQLVLTGFRAS